MKTYKPFTTVTAIQQFEVTTSEKLLISQTTKMQKQH